MFLPTINRRRKQYREWWRAYINGTTNRKILGAAFTIGLFASLTRVVSLTKELIVAWRFGTGDILEAFIIAFLIPSLLIKVIGGSFSIALIPTYIQVRENEGPASAQKLLSGVTLWGLGLLGVAVLVMVLGAPYYLPWIALGFDERKLILSLRVTYIVAPAIFFSGLSEIWGAILNAGERFALVALTPIVAPSITVLLLLFAGSLGIFTLALGVLSGSLLELSLLGLALKLRGFSLRPRWYRWDQNFRKVARQFSPRLAATTIRTSSTVVDRSMAALLPAGSVAALSYGDRLVSNVISLVSLALGSAVTPYFSKMVAHKDWPGIRHTSRHYLAHVFLVTVPLTVLLALFSRPIVRGLFERGSFTGKDTRLVAIILVLYALQIPFGIASVLVARLLVSLFAAHIVMWAAVINLALNIVLNILFIKVLGVAGIALSTSCALVVTFCFTSYHAVRLLRAHSADRLTQSGTSGALS